MQALTRHLHAFLREVRLTGDEWQQGIDFLTAGGHITDDRRQEFILLSDVLGASMQTVAINNDAVGDATEATVFGPFFTADAPLIQIGGDIAAGAAGQPCWVEDTVTDTGGAAVAAAHVEVWEADEDGFYDVQYADTRTAGRAQLYNDTEGRYAFWAVTPTPYPIPFDRPVGAMLAAVGRSPYRASHLHFMVTAAGRRTLVTHIFVAGDELLDSDCVFGVKDSLVKDFQAQSVGTPTPDQRDLGGVDAGPVRYRARSGSRLSCYQEKRPGRLVLGNGAQRRVVRPARKALAPAVGSKVPTRPPDVPPMTDQRYCPRTTQRITSGGSGEMSLRNRSSP